jgi:hypothetical protein
VNWLNDNADAIITGFYPGQAQGQAIADVLFGDYNPAGRIPVTFPQSSGQLPMFYNYKPSARKNQTAIYADGTSRYASIPPHTHPCGSPSPDRAKSVTPKLVQHSAVSLRARAVVYPVCLYVEKSGLLPRTHHTHKERERERAGAHSVLTGHHTAQIATWRSRPS